MTWVRGFWAIGSLLLAVAGCSGSTSDDGDALPPCEQWQVDICDFVERCGGNPTSCRQQAPAVACISDAEAARCSAAFVTAACDGTFPAGCDLTEIADPVPAVAKCNGYIEAVCARQNECRPGTEADCVSGAREVLNCSLALGIKPAYDQCLQEVAVLACEAPTAPDVCDGVILLSQ